MARARAAGAVKAVGADWGVLASVDGVAYVSGHVVPVEAGPSPFAGGPTLAVIGAGLIGRTHIDRILRHPALHLAAIVDPTPAGQALAETHIWLTLRTLFPYLWRYRLRVLAAIGCLVAAKVANVGVPMIFKEMIDGLSGSQQLLALPMLLLVLYGLLRFSTSLFTELREILFASVTQRAVRQVSLEVFRHLHALSLRFHLERQTGGVSRDIERGSRSIQSLLNYTIYNILPTLVEMTLVISLLSAKFDGWFAVITLTALVLYVTFTVSVTEWRTHFRRAMNEQDSKANTKAVDALINYETVKYFSNERFEQARYDDNLQRLERVSIKSQTELEMGGASAKMKSDGPAEVSGTTLKLSGQISAELAAPMVTVKADGMLTLKGGLVKIN